MLSCISFAFLYNGDHEIMCYRRQFFYYPCLFRAFVKKYVWTSRTRKCQRFPRMLSHSIFREIISCISSHFLYIVLLYDYTDWRRSVSLIYELKIIAVLFLRMLLKTFSLYRVVSFALVEKLYVASRLHFKS